MRIVNRTSRKNSCIAIFVFLFVLISFSIPMPVSAYDLIDDHKGENRLLVLEVVCPDADGGSFQCIDDLPAPATDSTSFVSLPGASIPNSSSSVSVSSVDIPSTNSGCTSDPITVTRTYSISNADMDLVLCTRTFIVEQIDPVQAICQNAVAYLNEAGVATISVSDVLDEINTPCPSGILDTTLSLDNFFCDDLNTLVPVTLFVTDVCGSSSTCVANVFVADTIDPQIVCPSDIIIDLDPCVCEAVVQFSSPDASDNCASAGLNVYRSDNTGLDSGDLFPSGTTTIEYTVEDAFGNLSTCSFDIILNATDPGPIHCVDSLNYSLDQNCTGIVTPQMLITEDQQCDLDAYTITLYDEQGILIPGNIVDGTHLWTSITAVLSYECYGNSCETIINIEDKMPPIIECADDTLSCSEMIVYPDPVVSENCGPYEIVLLNETIENVSCDDPELQKIITRVYQVSDSHGNSDVCTQYLSIEKLDINEVEAPNLDTTIYCGSGFPTDLNGNPDPSVTGAPTLSGISLWPDPYLVCNLVVTYEDIPMFNNGCIQKTLRQWTAYSWYCGEDQTAVFNQMITIQDTVSPQFVCPQDFQVFTPVLSCLASVELPYPDFDEACANGIELDIAYPGGFIDDAGVGEIIELPIGLHTISYTVYDDCLNSSNCSFEIEVIDNVQPIAICNTDVVIALGQDGTAILNAETINDGSFDECTLASVLIARMDAACDPDDLEFGEDIILCCMDVQNENMMVAVQVMDASGNTNQCMVAVTVIDELEPEIITPLPDISVSCEFPFDPDNLSIFGEVVDDPLFQDTIIISADSVEFSGPAHDGLVMDNCTMTITDEISEMDLDNCGQGYIMRTITISDSVDNQLVINQRIDFINYFPFDPLSINWPSDVLIEDECDPSIIPADLPTGSQVPEYEEDFCDQVAATFTDDTLTYYSASCFEIARTWFVADWCQLIDNQFLIVDSIQLISVQDTMAPLFTLGCTAPDTICSFSPDCGGTMVELITNATDNCDAVSDLSFSFEIDLDSDGQVDTNGTTNDATDIYPVGTHHIYWSVTDLCGNTSLCDFEFVIEHCGIPTPVCDVGLTFYVEPVDEDGDGIFDNEIVELVPSDIDGGSFDPCGTDLTLSFSPDTSDQLLVLDCEDFTQVDLELYVMDADGNQDYCSTFIFLADTNDVDICNTSIVSITGNVNTLSNKGLKEAILLLDGSGFNTNSDNEGEYSFPPMEAGSSYELIPSKNDDITNGVTTLDLVLIQKHILGMQTFEDPYQLIAADINRSSGITASDVLELQKIILGYYTEFTNNESWRFLESSYSFPDSLNPWKEEFPESYVFDPLVSDMAVDFTAIKVGDVNGTASQFDAGNETREISEVPIYLDRNEANIVRVKNEEKLSGMQFTLRTRGDQELLIESKLNKEGWMIFNAGEGVYTILYTSGVPVNFETDEILFETNIEILHLDSYVLDAIWIDETLSERRIVFEEMTTVSPLISLNQNSPNPWSTSTVIRFELQKAEKIVLRFMDINGQEINKLSGVYDKGIHEIQIDRSIIDSPGIILYELIAGDEHITKRMILLDH